VFCQNSDICIKNETNAWSSVQELRKRYFTNVEELLIKLVLRVISNVLTIPSFIEVKGVHFLQHSCNSHRAFLKDSCKVFELPNKE
jgi:hypothetical protein